MAHEDDLFDSLPPEEREAARAEAERVAAIAARAEKRAAERLIVKNREESRPSRGENGHNHGQHGANDGPKFVTKAERQRKKEMAKELAKAEKHVEVPPETKKTSAISARKSGQDGGEMVDVKTLQAIQARYIPVEKRERRKEEKRENTKGVGLRKSFKFEWATTEDTMDDHDLHYNAVSSRLARRGGRRDALDDIDRKSHKRQRPIDGHWSTKVVDEMTSRDWRIVREDHDIIVKGSRIPNPARNWEELSLPSPIREAIRSAGYTRPSPIQMQAIPICLGLRDLIGVAETGSGKTAAFLLPLLAFLSRQPRQRIESCCEDGPLSVILGPTRELVQQIGEEAEKLSSNMKEIRVAVVVGGNAVQDQIDAMRTGFGAQIVVATPGRLLECLENRYVVFNQCCYLVLDEADRMIDMGFEPQVEAVLKNMSAMQKSNIEAEVVEQEKNAAAGGALVRTTVMFSATMPQAVERLAQEYMRFPAIVHIGDRRSGKNKRIKQNVYLVPSETKKKEMLLKLVRETPPPIIVFANFKQGCDMVGRFLSENGESCCVLHGGKIQSIREANLAGFKSGRYDILIATDVAGRGLDISDVAHVINFEMASDIDRYTHRIGRTGRAGKTGLASTLLTESDGALFYDLVQFLKSTDSMVPRELAQHPKAKAPGEIQM